MNRLIDISRGMYKNQAITKIIGTIMLAPSEIFLDLDEKADYPKI